MTIIKTHQEGKTIFTLSGRIDSSTSSKLLEALLPEFEVTPFVDLDFSAVEHISPAGLRVLIQGHKAAIAKEGKMTLVGVTGEVKEELDTTGFSEILFIGEES
jgi:anti-anti-sigma factor